MTATLAQKYAKKISDMISEHVDVTVPEVFQTAKAGISKLNHGAPNGVDNLNTASAHLEEMQKTFTNIEKTLNLKAQDGRNLFQIFTDYSNEQAEQNSSMTETKNLFPLNELGTLIEVSLELISGLEHIRTVDEVVKKVEERKDSHDRAVIEFAKRANEVSENFQEILRSIISVLPVPVQDLIARYVHAATKESHRLKLSSRLIQNIGLFVLS